MLNFYCLVKRKFILKRCIFNVILIAMQSKMFLNQFTFTNILIANDDEVAPSNIFIISIHLLSSCIIVANETDCELDIFSK